MVIATTDRVRLNTPPAINLKIMSETERRIEYYQCHPERIPDRLAELDKEWDIERALETASASLSLYGLTLGILGRRRWLLLPLVVQGFFLQHAIQGWCPPLPLLRRLGFRTQQEIDHERVELEKLAAGQTVYGAP
jgi:hypothetical protein